MSRVLVTGASGFLGGHFVESLAARGAQVRCLVRPTSDIARLKPLGVEFIHGDLTQSTDWNSLLADIQIVYHLAGKISALRQSELRQVNTEGTHRLARACARRTSPPVLLLMSSIAAAGTSRCNQPRRECDPSHPVSTYGRSKRAAEQAVQLWARDVPSTIVRPGIVLGPRNREMLPIFQSVLRFRVHVVPGFAISRVSLIHVDDLIEITIRAAEHGARLVPDDDARRTCGRGYYFACAPEHPSYAELGRMIARAADRRPILLIHLPGPVPWLAAAANQMASRLRGRPDTFNLDKIREATAGSWVGSTECVRRDLGFRPPLPLEERLKQTAQWYMESGWL